MIEIREITKAYDGVRAVDDVSLTIESGEIVTVVGTSGSGKTTLLRMINRLVEPTSGAILIDGRDNRDLPGHELRRAIGYAIQGYGLFPHRTVAENIATVPKLLGWNRKRIDARVDELLALFHLEPAQFRARMPHELSGGQQQRIGVARALAAEPAVLLMDEPFGALDPIIRGKAQDDLVDIHRRFSTTIVLVTHGMDEAIRLGHRIAVMDKGRLLQFGTPSELIARPATDFVAALVGSADRAFRLMSLSPIGDLLEPGEAPGEPIDAGTSRKDALAEALWSGRAALPVHRDGTLVGRVTRDSLVASAGRPQ